MLPNSDEKLDPRVIRTRGLILKSFEDLLADKGFESISVQDVTDKAQVNRATFYAHFPDKYALLDYSIQKMFMAEIEKRRAKAPIPPAWSRAYLRPEEQNGDEVEECGPLTRE